MTVDELAVAFGMTLDELAVAVELRLPERHRLTQVLTEIRSNMFSGASVATTRIAFNAMTPIDENELQAGKLSPDLLAERITWMLDAMILDMADRIRAERDE